MAQELPFLNMTADDVKSLTPVSSVCTVLCEIDRVWAKESKNNGGTNIWFGFTCIDDNSPEKGKPSMKSFSLQYPTMFAPIICAAFQINKEEIIPEKIDLNLFKGKQLYVKFDLRDNGKDEFVIQPVDFFRADKPLA